MCIVARVHRIMRRDIGMGRQYLSHVHGKPLHSDNNNFATIIKSPRLRLNYIQKMRATANPTTTTQLVQAPHPPQAMLQCMQTQKPQITDYTRIDRKNHADTRYVFYIQKETVTHGSLLPSRHPYPTYVTPDRYSFQH